MGRDTSKFVTTARHRFPHEQANALHARRRVEDASAQQSQVLRKRSRSIPSTTGGTCHEKVPHYLHQHLPPQPPSSPPSPTSKPPASTPSSDPVRLEQYWPFSGLGARGTLEAMIERLEIDIWSVAKPTSGVPKVAALSFCPWVGQRSKLTKGSAEIQANSGQAF